MVPMRGENMNHPTRIGLASANEIFRVKEWSKTMSQSTGFVEAMLF